MAVYDVYEEEDQIITELEELTIYGSDRLGTCHAGTILNEVGVDAGPSSVGNKGVIFAEVMYDSPLTEDTAGKTVPPEVNRGEYFVLWNTTPDTVDMGDYQVKNLVNEETVTFSEMVLPPFQWLLVANADSVEDLQLVTALPWNTLNDNTVKTKLTTEFTMADDKGQLVLSYTSTSEVIDQVDYGSLSGLVATNAYVEENNLDSLHLRVPLKAIQREEISKPAIVFDPANFGTGDLEVQVEPVYNQDWFTSSHERRPGCKVYEMKNHLGNVLATVSDWKIGADTSVAGSVADYYLAQVRSLTDYLPFGMEMPGRVWSGDDYRYGFQGQEGDDEWSGSGNIGYTYFRTYNSRICRWYSFDPKPSHFESPYVSFANNSVQYYDILGDSIPMRFYNPDGKLMDKIPDQVKKMFAQEYGIRVGYNSQTRMVYYEGETETNLQVSKSAKKLILEALNSNLTGDKATWRWGEVVWGYNLGPSHPCGDAFFKVDGGATSPSLTSHFAFGLKNSTHWRRGVSFIDLGDFNSEGLHVGIDYSNITRHGLDTRTMNLGRWFEHEYLGHALTGRKDGVFGKTKPGPAVKLVNSFRVEMGLKIRLNYGAFEDRKFFFGKSGTKIRKIRKKYLKNKESVPYLISTPKIYNR